MKPKRWFLQLRRSLFFKLILIFLATAILLAVLVSLAAAYLSDPERFIHKKISANMAQYTSYLLQEIGSPPDYKKAGELATRLGLEIQIKNANTNWHSEGYAVPSEKVLIEHIGFGNAEKIGHYRGYSFVILQQQDYEILIAVNHKHFSENKSLFLIVLVFIIIIVVSFSYYLVRWQFRPIKWLSEGVSQLAEGNLAFKMRVRKHDELGELAAAFNKMSAEIQSMINSKEQLLLDVSHELRSPLTRMKLALELLEDSSPKSNLQEDVRDLEGMITELLETARLNKANTPLNKTTFDLQALINEFVAVHCVKVPAIKNLSQAHQTVVFADRERLRTVLRNLIDNAQKYSQLQTKSVEIDVQESAELIKIIVRDYGEGIPQQDQAHIFEPFYRVDKSRNIKTGGYGLGLSLSKKIMTAHGGDLTVASQIGNGSTFSVLLPRSS